MKLARLTLDGFKSFGHRTEIGFDNGITVLVGPNGCGKSNVVDAIKWVLGERSVKSLRSEEMLDVVFNGAASTKPAGYAEVSLSFTNSNGRATGAPIPLDYEEITIARRLYRSGESEYLINKQPCRLKDIRELFIGTGIGMEFYSIIEQGRIEVILRGSPAERRELLDEAAGVSKYKAKRRESEAKLERVEQDLTRLQDILHEVRRGIRSIKIQATRAEKYKNTLEELKTKKTELALHTFHQYYQKQSEITGKLSELKSSCAQVDLRLREVENALIATDKEILQIDDKIANQQGELVNLSVRSSQTRQMIESDTIRHKELVADEEKTRQNIAGLTQKAIELRSRLVEIMQTYEALKHEADVLRETIDEKDTLYKQISEELETLIKHTETKRNEVFQATHKRAQYQNEISLVQSEIKELSNRREKSSQRLKEINDESEEIKENKTKLEATYKEIANRVNKLKEEIAHRELVIKALKNDLATLNNEIGIAKEEFNRAESRKDALEDLESHYEGCSNGTKAVLTAKANISDGIYGLVADIIIIRPEYANAAEAGLKGLSDAVIVKSQEDALKVIRFVKDNQKGRISVIILEKLKEFSLRAPLVSHPQINSIVGYADNIIQEIKLDNVSGQTKSALARFLLGNYLLVDTLETAKRVLEERLYNGSILTLQGEIISSDGFMAGGSQEAASGLIIRKTELRYLQDKVLSLSEQLKNLELLQSDKQAEIETEEVKAQNIRNAIYDAKIEAIETEKSISEIERRLSIIYKEIEIHNLEKAQVEAQIALLSEKAVTIATVIKELEGSISRLSAEIEQINNSGNEYLQKKQSVEIELTELKIKQAKTLSNKEHCLSQQSQLNSDISQLEQTLDSLVRSLEEIKNRVSELSYKIESDEILLKDLVREQGKTQEVISSLKENLQVAKNNFAEQKSEEERVLSEIQRIQKQIQELSFTERECSLLIDNLCEKHKEETSVSLRELYLSYHPQSRLGGTPEAGDTDSSENYEQISASIEELKKRLSEMSDGVNLSAIDELKSLEERNQFLSRQEQDLIKARDDLRDFIRKTNRECKERFEKTFEQVNENFNHLFRKLFGGGKAELVLEKPQLVARPEATTNQPCQEDTTETTSQSEPKELLEYGIEIIAKPPGKEPTSICLLSGGEKALTALALVMAIFKFQPSPFCILDEADSTLDENNVDRFCGLVKEFALTTQFVVITHNKKTMLAGDVLYGLTMPTPGISRKISVKMDEVDKFISLNACSDG
jgi:chromosome segregation protein